MNDAEKKLVEALRSGNYHQTKHQLRNENRFCCLGVACDIFNLGHWAGDCYHWFDDEGHSTYEDVDLPDSVRVKLDWYGWNGELSFSDRDGFTLSLALLNDDGMSFSQIADVIEAGLVK